MTLSARHLVCTLALSLLTVSTVDALPLYEYVDISSSEVWVTDGLLSKKNPPKNPHPSAASLHAEIPPPWHDFILGLYLSAAPFHASIPPPWYSLAIGGAVSTPPDSSNVEVDFGTNAVGQNSESLSILNQVASALSVESPNIPAEAFDTAFIASASIPADLFEVAEPVPGDFTFNGGAPGASSVQQVDLAVPSSSNSVPEPTSAGLITLGLVGVAVYRKKRLGECASMATTSDVTSPIDHHQASN